MKTVFSLAALIIVICCTPKNDKIGVTGKVNDTLISDNGISDSLLEEKIVNAIFKIKKVVEKNKYIDSITQHKQGITLMFVHKPDSNSNYYIVQAGFNSNLRFEPYYNFYVYPPSLKIKYLDTENNELIPVEEWH